MTDSPLLIAGASNADYRTKQPAKPLADAPPSAADSTPSSDTN